jgi:hypothetical protein
VTEAGVLSAALLLETVTTEPPAGADEDRVTVHVELAPEATLVGEHCRAETVGATGVTVTAAVLELPFKVAVTVTD